MDLPAEAYAPTVVRRRMRTWLAGLEWPCGHAEDVVLAVNEAVSNAVDYAYPDDAAGTIDVAARAVMEPDGVRVVISIVDHGRWRQIPTSLTKTARETLCVPHVGMPAKR